MSHNPRLQHTAPHLHKQEVYVLRDWKEYIGESFLIIFSVLLALILTEFINHLHEKSETKELLQSIRTELIRNRDAERVQYKYHLRVIWLIDSSANNKALQQRLIQNDAFNLKQIAPEGVLYRYLDNIAWDIAKNHNILSRIDFKTADLLTHIYDEQDRIMKTEDEVAKIIFDRESRKPENTHTTLMIIRDTYRGWAVDRAPGLLKQYNDAIRLLDSENH